MDQIINIWGEEAPYITEKNKWGYDVIRFRNRPAKQVEDMLDSALFIVTYFKENFDLDIHLAYGTLLGAVRDGGLIKHDDDFDLSYISKGRNPKEVIEEAKHITNALEKDQLLSQKISDAHFGIKKNMFYFDITLSWLENEFYNLYYVSYMSIPENSVLPLISTDIFGRQFKMPKDSVLLLQDIYGVNWEKPIQDYYEHTNNWDVEKNFVIFRQGYAKWGANATLWQRFYKKFIKKFFR